MKRFVTLCCVLATLAAGVCAQDGARRPAPQLSGAPMPLNHGGKIETAYDGFARETVVSLKRMSVTCEAGRGMESRFKNLCIRLEAVLHCPGKQLEYVRRATLRLTFEAKDWDARHSPNERQLSAVADGETIQLGTLRLVKQEAGEGWFDNRMKEVLELSVPYAAFERLARAQFVELAVGRTSFALRDKNVAALRDLNSRVLVSAKQARQ